MIINKLPECIIKGKSRPWKFTFENKYIVQQFCMKINISKIPGRRPNLNRSTTPQACVLKLGVLYDRIVKLYNFDKEILPFEFFVYVNNVSLMNRLKVLKVHDVEMLSFGSKVFYLHKTNIILCSSSLVTEALMAQAMLAHLLCNNFGHDLFNQHYQHLIGHILKRYLKTNLTKKKPVKKGVV